jgi:hypothetical protein
MTYKAQTKFYLVATGVHIVTTDYSNRSGDANALLAAEYSFRSILSGGAPPEWRTAHIRAVVTTDYGYTVTTYFNEPLI